MTVKIALYKGTRAGFPGVYNYAVRAWTCGPYSHCELIAKEHTDGTVTVWGASWSDGGVRKKSMLLDHLKWDIIEVAGDLISAVAWFESHEGNSYDLRGNFGLLLRPLGDSRDKWFCSEAIMAALGFSEPWRFCPNSIAAIFVRKQ